MTELWTADGERLVLGDEPVRRGGESRVYFARDASGSALAVKVALLPLPAGRWLDDERTLLAKLASDEEIAPFVVPVRHHGVWGDRPFLTMDWFPHTLETFLAGGPPAQERLAMARRLAEAVAAVQERRPRLVHRDIKPSNVLVGADGRVCLADFGTARQPLPGGTTTSTVLFTPGYAPPEQTLPLPSRPEPSWDTFALAATVYACVVGRPPEAVGRNPRWRTDAGHRLVAGRRPPAELALHAWLDFDRMVALSPDDLGALRARVEGPLEQALRPALEPDPSRRSGSARGIAEALAQTRVRTAPGAPRRRAAAVGVAIAALTSLVAIGAGAPLLTDAPPAYAMVTVGEGHTAFALGEVEVTQGLWREVTGDDPARTLRRYSGSGLDAFCDEWEGYPLAGDDLPVACVSWFDAVRFANALSERHGLEPAYRIGDASPVPQVEWDRSASGYRLPTAAEWASAAGSAPEPAEACRTENVLDRAMRLHAPRLTDEAPCSDGHVVAAPVASFPASRSGLHDVHGNVSEWVWDAEGGLRASRGGSWGGPAGANLPDPPEMRWVTRGFRLARSLP